MAEEAARKTMGHYEIGEWTDFVRNLLAKQQQAEMEQHQAICAECRDIVALLAKVNTAAQADTCRCRLAAETLAVPNTRYARAPR